MTGRSDTIDISRDARGTFHLRTAQRVEAPLDATWEFFSRAENLEAITPPFLGFEVVTPRPIDMHEGTLLDYRIRLHGLPISWRTRIDEWVPGERFVDRQLRGPYLLWHHTHTFAPDGSRATFVEDHVRYRTVGGRLTNALVVRRDLVRIFEHRAAKTRELLEGAQSPSGLVGAVPTRGT